MLSHEGLTQIHSQKKPRLHFGESFTLKFLNVCSVPTVDVSACNVILLLSFSYRSLKWSFVEVQIKGFMMTTFD